MQTAHILLAIGGDAGNTVPKRNVRASEIAVLRAIHGDQSVTEIEPAEDDASFTTHKAEIARLTAIYGKEGPNGKDISVVADLYPGAAARVFEDLAELEIPDDFYKAEARAKAPEPSKKAKTVRVKPADEIEDMDVLK